MIMIIINNALPCSLQPLSGTMNFFSGPGRETMGPLMSTGDIDVLAFIGGTVRICSGDDDSFDVVMMRDHSTIIIS